MWEPIETPLLTPKFAGIGTRELNEAGKQAIKDVYKKTFSQSQSVVKDQLNTTPKSEIFLYLSEQLADKFGYVNPGSEPVPSVMDILAKKQIVTQEDIDKRENECK